MAPIPVWSGNLRLSLVLVPVRLYPATSTEGTIAFRMIHEPSGKPIKYLKGVETEQGFEEVPEEEIIKGYEHAKGHHVLINPEEIDALKLEAKHTIDMARFVDLDEIDSRYFEKPYYLLPDGDSADEGYVVLRDALAKSNKMAIGQLIMHGREHLVGITAHKKGLMLLILRYADELRKPEPYFDKIEAKADADAVKLATDLIEQESGKFQPEKMPNEYARAVHELVQAKIEQRAPEVEIETAKGETAEGHQHHGRPEEEHAGEGTGEGQRRSAEANGKGGAKARHCSFVAFDEAIAAPNCSLVFAGADKLPTHLDAETTRIFRVECLNHHPGRAVEHYELLKLGDEPLSSRLEPRTNPSDSLGDDEWLSGRTHEVSYHVARPPNLTPN